MILDLTEIAVARYGLVHFRVTTAFAAAGASIFTFSMADDANTSEYVTLVSNDGYQFVVKRSAACVSGALRRMLDPKSRSSLSVRDQLMVLTITSYPIGNFSEAIENKATLENLK